MFLNLGELKSGSLDTVYEHVVDCYVRCISWYMAEKQAKARWAKVLRGLGIFAVVLGGIIPLISVIDSRINSNLGYILIALAAGLQLMDSFLGMSSAWKRYVLTATRLNSLLLSFQADWLHIISQSKIDAEQVGEIASQYLKSLAVGLSADTEEWNVELGQAIRDLDGMSRRVKGN